jgi:GT2 family glycosyltransferase
MSDRDTVDTAQEKLGVCAVICTRDRPVQLQRALDSLLSQTRPPAQILVVNNAPTVESTQDIVRTEFPTVSYVREPVPGLDFARNRALREASQQIVAFLDDDAVAAPSWIAATGAVFEESPSIAICTGKVEALELETEGQRLFEANGGYSRGDARLRLPRDARRRLGQAPLIAWSISVGSGCSLAVRRKQIMRIGGFDEALDMGPELPGGGDLDIIWRALTAGFEVVYEPEVQARHEHRREVADTIDQIVEHNRSLIAVLTKAAGSARGGQQLGVILFLLWRLAKPGVRLGRRLVGRDPLPAASLLRLWWQCWRGLSTYGQTRRLAHLRGEHPH